MNSTERSDFDAARVPLFSPEEICSWSFGEVTRPETINYRTLKPVKDGLFCERTFGSTKDYECSCGKYKGLRYEGIICDRCGVDLVPCTVRRERMGHISLETPVAHACFARGAPSPMASLLGIPQRSLEQVIYFSRYIVISVDEERGHQAMKVLEEEMYQKTTQMENTPSTEIERIRLQTELQQRLKDIRSIRPMAVLTKKRYRELSERYDFFTAGMGAEALLQILKNLNLETLKAQVIQEASSSKRRANNRFLAIDSLQRAGAKPEWMVLTVLPVLPPDLRPIVQLDRDRFASHDLNDIYRRVISRNNRLRGFRELGVPQAIVRREKQIQQAVDALMESGQFWTLLKEVLLKEVLHSLRKRGNK